jgi:hypothetical protein
MSAMSAVEYRERGDPRRGADEEERAMDKTRPTGAGDYARAEKFPSGAADGDGSTSIADEGRGVVGQAQVQAEKLAGFARAQATTRLTTQQGRAAKSLGVVATALHDASRQLRGQNEPEIGAYLDLAATQVEHLAGMLNDQDIAQLLDATEQFARRRPALFIAAAVVVGFAGMRILRSAARTQGQMRAGGQSSFARPEPSGWAMRSGEARAPFASADRNADEQREHVEDQVQGFWHALGEHPVAAGAVGTAIGGIAGLLLPESEREHQLLGEARDRVIGGLHDVSR